MRRLTALAAVLLFVAAGCNSSSSSPSAPALITLDAFQTAVQPAPGGVRVQVRMRVMSGLAELEGSVARGGVRARTCNSGECEEGPVAPGFIEASCPAVAGAIDFGTAFLDRDVAGVDFCIAELASGLTFETTVISGGTQSNVITTLCTSSTFGVVCGSG